MLDQSTKGKKIYLKIDKLQEWGDNPRSIKKKDFERLKRQIKKLGQYKPLIINEENIVLGGNMRLKAYRELGIDKIWVNVVKAPTYKEKIEYALSDNDRAGYYEDEALAELLSLEGVDIDLEDYKVDLGKQIDLEELMQQFGPDAVEDEAPPLPKKAVSKYGEVYELGKHKLMCGDATKIEDVEKLMDGRKVDMVFTDPPYNVNWDYRGKHKERGLDPIFNDNLSEDEWDEFVSGFTSNLIEFLKEGRAYYICTGYNSLGKFEEHLKNLKAEPRQLIIWAKNYFVMGKHGSDYHRQHEQLWYGWKTGKSHIWYGGHKQSDLWAIDKVFNMKMVHSTEKPVALPLKAIRNSSKEGDLVLDLFGGSGSTLIACEQTNRIAFLMELDPKYCDVIRERYENYASKKS